MLNLNSRLPCDWRGKILIVGHSSKAGLIISACFCSLLTKSISQSINQSINLLLGGTVLATRGLPVSPDAHANEWWWRPMDWEARLTTMPSPSCLSATWFPLILELPWPIVKESVITTERSMVSFWEKLDRKAFIQTVLSLKDKECSWDRCLKTSLWSEALWQVCQLQLGSVWVSSVRLQMAGELDRVALAFNLSTCLFYFIFFYWNKVF